MVSWPGPCLCTALQRHAGRGCGAAPAPPHGSGPMSFLAPAFGALAALAALIIVQYFLKLRRPARTIPSTFLWQRALADTRANAPWQRLHADPLLMLQLLALLALVLALMRPYVLRAGAAGENIVLVLDASLTTQTT